MEYIKRLLEKQISRALSRNKSILLLGARQTGKTTLVKRFKSNLLISFVSPEVRQRYEKNPQMLKGEIESLVSDKNSKKPLVVLDEVQKVPAVLDTVQEIIDENMANFILTGSSARKLRRGTEINLLPGRVVALRMDPFNIKEFPAKDLNEKLFYGSLPGIMAVTNQTDREVDLESYVTIYLEEEIRAEAAVRNLGDFARFLELAASESGGIINLRKLSQEIGVSHTTIAAYYQILEDCLIIDRIEPLTSSKTRKKLIKSEKYIFFDLGVRRLAAGEGKRPPKSAMGGLFEQFVGLELLRFSRIRTKGIKIKFWRDPDGPEVDWIVDEDGELKPIEVKFTESPVSGDIRNLQIFLSEYNAAKIGYLVCRVPRKTKLSSNVVAIPWQEIEEIFD